MNANAKRHKSQPAFSNPFGRQTRPYGVTVVELIGSRDNNGGAVRQRRDGFIAKSEPRRKHPG
jgi:hypothetical protein